MSDYDRFVCLAAAGDLQFAMEQRFSADSPPAGQHGVFSHALIHVLAHIPPGESWEQVRRAIKREVEKSSRQTIHWVGNLRMEIFQPREVTSDPHFKVASVDEVGRSIVLDHGQMSGIEQGALVGVYRREASRLVGSADLVGTYKATDVRPRTTVAVSDGPFRQVEGARAVEVGSPAVVLVPGEVHQRHRILLTAGIPADVKQALEEAVRQETKLLEIGSAEKVIANRRDFVVTLEDEQDRKVLVIDGEPCVRRMELADDAKEREGTLRLVMEWIRDAIHWTRFRDIDHPDPQALDAEAVLRVTFDRGYVVEKEGKQVFKLASPLPSDAETSAQRFRDGDSIKLSYENVSKKPFYVSIAYLSNDAVIKPWNEAQFHQRLEPGKRVTLRRWVTVRPPFGFDFVKVFVTRREAFDLRPFSTTSRYRGPATGWVQPFYHFRGGSFTDEDLEEEWDAVTIPIQILENR